MPKQRNDGLVAKRVLFSVPYLLILALQYAEKHTRSRSLIFSFLGY